MAVEWVWLIINYERFLVYIMNYTDVNKSMDLLVYVHLSTTLCVSELC